MEAAELQRIRDARVEQRPVLRLVLGRSFHDPEGVVERRDGL